MTRISSTRRSTACPSKRHANSSLDYEHSNFEDRFIAIGPIGRGLVMVVYTEREEDVTRIIGARLANENEQSLYRSNKDQYR